MALRVAVIGCGNIGRTHAGVYKNHPLAELVAVCDLVPERADRLAAQFGVRAYYSVEEMLARERLDVVSVATAGPENGGHHFAPTMQALEAGVHVLCEKPLSNNLDEARQMVALARARGLYLGTNLNHRFTPAAQKGKEIIDRGLLGEPLFINMHLWIQNPNETSPWFHLRALHPHSIDIMRYFFGDIRRVHCLATRSSRRTIWTTAVINVEFANGAVGHLTGSYEMSNLHPIERCEVAGTEGRFVIENVFEEFAFYPHKSKEITVIRNGIMGPFQGFQATFAARIGRFLEQIHQQVPPSAIEGSGEEGFKAQAVIEAAIQSFQTGAVVEVSAL